MKPDIKQKVYMVFAAACLLLLAGCGHTEQKSGEETSAARSVFAMDTFMSLSAYGERAEEALDAAEAEINRLEALFSTTISGSEAETANENGSIILSEETGTLVKTALTLYEETDGAFDITVYPLMCEWGFVSGEYQVPKKARIRQLLKKVDASQIEYDEESRLLTLPDGVEIDFGGIAKGYTSSRIMEIYEEYGLTAGLVSLGGNVQVYQTKTDGSPYEIAIASPDDNEAYVGVIEAEDEAIITSGGYERYFEQDGTTYHHILDPATGYPAQSGLVSVTVVSADGTKADGLSTALFVLGKEKALAYWREHSAECDLVLVEENGSVTITKGLEGRFSSERDFTVVSL